MYKFQIHGFKNVWIATKIYKCQNATQDDTKAIILYFCFLFLH